MRFCILCSDRVGVPVKTVVLGLGNIIMSDDGVGVHVIRLLQKRYEFPQEIEVLDGGMLVLDLLSYIEGVQRLLIVDALQVDAPPGTIVRLEGGEIPSALSMKYSSHQISLSDLLMAARLLGRCPSEIVLWGVQPARLDLGLELSPVVAAQVEPLVQNVLAELQRWGIQPIYIKLSGLTR